MVSSWGESLIRTGRSWLGPGLLVVAGLADFFRLFVPYVDVGRSVVPDVGFERPPVEVGWMPTDSNVTWETVGGGAGSITISADDGRGGSLDYVLGSVSGRLRVRARVRTDGVRLGEYRWSNARVVLYFLDSTKTVTLGTRHAACQFLGDNAWALCEQVFTVPPQAASGVVALQNLGSAGKAWFDDVSVTPVIRRPDAPYLIGGAVAIWVAGFVWCVITLRLWNSRRGLLTLLILVGIVAGVSVPGALLDRTVLGSLRLVDSAMNSIVQTPDLPSTEPPLAPTDAAVSTRIEAHPLIQVLRAEAEAMPGADLFHVLYEIGHTALFAVLGVTLAFGIRRGMIGRAQQLLGAVAGGLLFAAATEVLQHAVADREPRWSDVGRDTVGLVLGLTIVLVVHGFSAWRNHKAASLPRR